MLKVWGNAPGMEPLIVSRRVTFTTAWCSFTSMERKVILTTWDWMLAKAVRARRSSSALRLGLTALNRSRSLFSMALA